MEAQIVSREPARPRRNSRVRPGGSSGGKQVALGALLELIARPGLEPAQQSFLTGDGSKAILNYRGDLDHLQHPAIAIVGARDVSSEGASRANRLSRELAVAGVTIVSGLAKGVDSFAHRAALSAGGRTVAVIGTPLDKAYPAEHKDLQDLIAREHLLISPFDLGTRVFLSNFPKRNRVMAAVSDGSVIVEASDTSGTLHQAAECQRLGRWLFILKSVFQDSSLKWPASFESYSKTVVVESSADILGKLA